MEHISQSQAEVYHNGAVTSWEYKTRSEKMNGALIHVNGRYPETGFTANQEVDSIIQIIGGDGAIEMIDGTRGELAQGDQLHIAIDEAYFFEGNLELFYAATPSWTPEQTSHID